LLHAFKICALQVEQISQLLGNNVIFDLSPGLDLDFLYLPGRCLDNDLVGHLIHLDTLDSAVQLANVAKNVVALQDTGTGDFPKNFLLIPQVLFGPIGFLGGETKLAIESIHVGLEGIRKA
jgi:hypothetical protein